MSTPGRVKGIGLIHYPSRIIGFLLAISVFWTDKYYMDGGLVNWYDIALVVYAFIHPHLVLFLYWRSGSNKKVETNALLFDTTISGIAAALLSFNWLPTLVMLTFTSAGNLIAKGYLHFFKGLVAMAIGILIGAAAYGFDFDIRFQTEYGTMISVSIFVVIYTLLFAFAANQAIIEVIKAKRLINRQKKEIDDQKLIIEEKNQDILDSIHYAKRIQSAILPPITQFNKAFPDAFVMYEPKDVVAGDFYWMEQAGDQVLLAAADCTGHGVPGAMVSVVCNNALNRAVREYGLSDPGKILDKTREIVIGEFEKSEEEVKDGMDIALISAQNHDGKWLIKYAGAHNSLWILRNGSEVIEEIKADKQPIGKFEHSKDFTTHSIEVELGDQIYIHSDGYADQFGGEKGKKLKAANFKRLILEIKDLPMKDQHQKLSQAFHDWRGDLEQLDDVCVIGIRI